MTLPKAPITDEMYSPEEEFEAQPHEAGQEVQMRYTSVTEFPLPNRLTGKQIEY